MNQLAAELRTPPLPVLAFINCPELHKDIGTYFNATLRPPLFFVSLPEANEAVLARLFGEGWHHNSPLRATSGADGAPTAPCLHTGTPKQQKAFHTPDGILKVWTAAGSVITGKQPVHTYTTHMLCVPAGGLDQQAAHAQGSSGCHVCE